MKNNILPKHWIHFSTAGARLYIQSLILGAVCILMIANIPVFAQKTVSMHESASKKNSLGEQHLQNGNFALAYENFLAATEIDGSDPIYMYNTAVAAVYLGEKDVALKWFQRTVETAAQQNDFEVIDQSNAQIRELLSEWPSWAIDKIEKAYSLPETDAVSRAQENWNQLIQEANGAMEDQSENAVPLLEKALDIAKTRFGKAHPATLTTLSVLARAQEAQSQWEQAEQLYLQASKGLKETLGQTHPETLGALKMLADFYESRGQSDKAEPLYQEALNGFIAEMGDKSPLTLETMQRLALLYKGRGNYETAQDLLEKACKSYEQILGLRHPETLSCLEDSASLYQI
ncbi:tetratricopeptide repeat protein, partial [Thermodesulfobacteriota bacterium]